MNQSIIKYPGAKWRLAEVIGRIESNSYCDTPIMGGTKAVLHDEIVSVLNVVHCGVSEDKVIRVALDDCEILQQPNEPLTLEELRGMDGEPVWIDFAGGLWALVDAPDHRLWAGRAGRYEVRNFKGRIYRRPPKEEK